MKFTAAGQLGERDARGIVVHSIVNMSDHRRHYIRRVSAGNDSDDEHTNTGHLSNLELSTYDHFLNVERESYLLSCVSRSRTRQFFAEDLAV
jgi:hypothetical protein